LVFRKRHVAGGFTPDDHLEFSPIGAVYSPTLHKQRGKLEMEKGPRPHPTHYNRA